MISFFVFHFYTGFLNLVPRVSRLPIPLSVALGDGKTRVLGNEVMDYLEVSFQKGIFQIYTVSQSL